MKKTHINLEENIVKRVSFLIILILAASFSFAQTPGTVKWTFKAGDEIFGTPAIGADGTIYVTSNDHYLYAITPEGHEKWRFDAEYGLKASPVVAPDGTIYIARVGLGALIAVNPDGTKKWQVDADGWVTDSPGLMADGTVVFATTNQNFYGVNPDGSGKWTIQLGWNEYSSPAIGADGTIYIGLNSGGLYARNADGTAKWNFRDAGKVQSSPAIGADGTVYVGSYDKNLYAINTDGTQKWAFKTGGMIVSSPTIGPDGTIYFGSYDHNFYAVNPDGTEKWYFTANGLVAFYYNDSPTVGADGVVYVTAVDTVLGFNKWLYAFNPDGTVKWTFQNGDAITGAPAIGQDSTIYIGQPDGTLYALYGTSAGLAHSPWPRFRHDNQGTGNVETPTAVKEIQVQIPNGFSVSEAYPNPFNPVTTIQFAIPRNARVHLAVFNAAGELVDELLNETKSAGTFRVSWNASRFSSGVYFIQVSAGAFKQIRKILLVK